MNEKLRAIFARRSVREFTDRPVPEPTARDLLDAAMAAPSACAKDPWEFVVVRRRETLNAMAEVLPNGQMLRAAPMALLVCGDVERAHDRQESYLLQDCSAAIQNVLLAASALGLGACWLGVHPRHERMDGMRKLFKLPDRVTPVSAIAIGWPAATPAARTRYHQGRVHQEAW
jgi:nitroreductase